MLNKEEVENILNNRCDKCNLAECIGCEMTYTERNKIKEYIEQQEQDKQKLIEKLEGDIEIFGNYEERKQMQKEQLYENDGKWFYAQEILNFAKGEKG